MSSSLQSFYGLLAIFPILALPLLMGGVTGAEFWRLQLALVNGLFFSLALGMFVSSLTQDSQRSLQTTFLLLLFVLVGLPLLDPFYHWSSMPHVFLAAASPGTLFIMCLSNNFSHFWSCILISNLLGWIFLALASYYTPRFWQQKSIDAKSDARAYNWKFGSPARRQRVREKLMKISPVCWLIARQPWQGLVFRILIWIGLAGFLVMYVISSRTSNSNWSQATQIALGGGSGILSLCLHVWMASQASRFFVEGQRTGALELLLCTPLPVEEIIRGQWQALRRLFFWPVVFMLVLTVIGSVLQMRNFAAMKVPAGSVTFGNGIAIFAMINKIIGLPLGLLAYGWVAMWLGLVSRKANVAVMKTFLFVMIIPWFGNTFLQVFQIFIIRSGAQSEWFGIPIMMFIHSFAWIAKDIAFIFWARKNLRGRLRGIASGGAIAKKPANILPPTNVPPVMVSPA